METLCTEKEISVCTERRLYFRQLFVSSTTWALFFMFGLSLGTPTVAIPQLRKEADPVSNGMASMITASIGYMGMVWIPIITSIAHFYGCKLAAYITTLNAFAGFIVLYFGSSAVHVLISQIIQGLTAAAQTTICLAFCTEYISPKYRSIFVPIKAATLFWGIWVANAIGTFSDFRYIGGLGIICTIYNLVTFLVIPESPYWLASKQRYEECAFSHRWLKGVDENGNKELEMLTSASKNRERIRNKTAAMRIQDACRNIVLPEVYKPISLCILLITLYHCSGKFVYTMYSIQIIKKITNSESTAYVGMLVLDGFTVFGMYVGCGLSKHLKRRTLLLSSCVFGAIFLYVISVYLFLIKFSIISENKYISVGLLTGFSIAICGPMILSGSLSSELIPLRARSMCLCLSSLFSKFVMGSILLISPSIFAMFDFHGTFLIFSLLFTVCIILVYKYMPETKDKTLHQISDLFRNNPCEDKLLSQKNQDCGDV